MRNPSDRIELKFARILRRRRIQAVAMSFFMGPLGLFYIDPFGGFVMSALALIMLLVAPVAGTILVWNGCMVWAVIAVNKSYARFKARAPYFSGSLP